MGDAVVDASVWVSLMVATERHHLASRRWLIDRTRAGTLLVAPALMLPEVGGALARRTGAAGLARRALERLSRLPGLRLVPLDHALAEIAGQLAISLALRGADAVYVATARALALPLISWDTEQLTRGARAVRVLTPAAA